MLLKSATFIALLAAVAVGVCAGCGGGGGGGGGAGAAGASSGGVQIAVTDAASDEIDRFEVDITSISLVRRNGLNVETLPVTTRVDFAELVQLAELLSAAFVPHGAYGEASLTLDFSTASVHIAGAAADAQILDGAGQPLSGPLTVEIDFESHRPLVVSPGLARILTLDFDLDASLTIDAGANTVTVLPVLIADIDLQRPLVHRVRGLLESVDVARESFDVAVRPFRAAVSKFGVVRVATESDTHFEIDGQCYVGSAGITALAALPALAPVVAIGRFRIATGRFEAEEVLAGLSVAGGDLDIAAGVVTSRVGETLTLAGAHIERDDGTMTFDAEMTIVLDPANTIVTKQLSLDLETTGAISVGQEVVAFGELTGTPGSFQLAPVERVRMLHTRLTGTIVSSDVGQLTLALDRIARRPPEDFDFAGTGGVGGDADPENYEVATGVLDLSGFSVDTTVRVLGFVSDFGAAPPDFEARTLIETAGTGAGP